MAKKRTAYNTRKAPRKKLSKNALIGIGCALFAAIVACVIIVIVCNIDPDIDVNAAKASLKADGYTVGAYVPKANGYVGVTETVSATYIEVASDSLEDYLDAEAEEINLIVFDNEDNAEAAFEDFDVKWGEEYEECDIAGNIIYFGTSAGLEALLKSVK